MIKHCLFLLLTISGYESFSQRLLASWSQQNIENYTKEMYDEAQQLTPSELLIKNLNDKSWSAVFLTLNASVNNYSKDSTYLRGLANQITNSDETKLAGTSRLIIWDRIITGDITFEGKGLVIDNDLFKVGGRANQILQNLTNKNFGFVTLQSTREDLEQLKNKWLNFLSGKSVEEYKPIEYKNSKISEITSLTAVQALVVSLQDNPKKQQITRNCLRTFIIWMKCQRRRDLKLVTAIRIPTLSHIWECYLEIKNLTKLRMPTGGKSFGTRIVTN